jgi:two-component system LytT family response regulator
MFDVLIVDDEAPARRRLRDLLATETDVRIAGESNNVPDALIKIGASSPNLLFLDIRMPGLTGLDLLSRLDPSNRPSVIFTTAHTNYSLLAFEFDAVDYLVKPIERERFQMALEKARRRIPSALPLPTASMRKSAEPPATPAGEDRRKDRIAVHIGRTTKILALRQIVRIVADGDYLNIHLVDGDQLKTRDRMHSMEIRLSSCSFVRVNRSTMVNKIHISAIEPSGRGELEIKLSDGMSIVSGALFHDRIVTWLEELRR